LKQPLDAVRATLADELCVLAIDQVHVSVDHLAVKNDSGVARWLSGRRGAPVNCESGAEQYSDRERYRDYESEQSRALPEDRRPAISDDPPGRFRDHGCHHPILHPWPGGHFVRHALERSMQ